MKKSDVGNNFFFFEKAANLGNTLVSVSQRIDRDTRTEIEELAPVYIPDVRAFSVG